MKPMCEANCGKRTQVYGAKYCPECHKRYAPARFSLQFTPAGEPPRKANKNDSFLLLNQCDGYHLAMADFNDDGTFAWFISEDRDQIYSQGSYVAWAALPDSLKELHPIFVDG